MSSNRACSNTKNNNNSVESPLHMQNQSDAALQHSIGYAREFSTQAAAYHLLKTEEPLVHLHRTIVLLSTKIQPHCFAPTHLELAKFFVDLQALMSALDDESDALWACVALLQHCSRNLEARRAIVEQYCYVPVLSYLLVRTTRPERVHRLMLLLQDLTYGIRIAWEEPYLVVLLEHLVDIVHNTECDASETASPQDDSSHALLALSILVNLCYKNFVVLFLFLRRVNISSFSRRIQHYGLLANKMLIILSQDVHPFEERELHIFLRTSFAAIDECLKQWNVPQLSHIVDFLLDSQCHPRLQRAMLTHTHYCEDIERLLDQIDARSGMDDSSEDMRKHQQLCMDLIFRLVSHVLQLSTKDNSNIISLDAITPRLYELLCCWMESEHCGVAAIELLSILLRVGRRGIISQLIAREPTTVIKLVASTKLADTKPDHVMAILRLLLTLLRESKTEKLVLAEISESYFDNILAAPLALKPELLSKHAIAQSEIDKAIFCLLLLINFANIAKKAYFDKCRELLDKPQLQYAMARAMVSGTEQVASAVFKIAQFEHFPRAAVAKHVANISASGNSNGETPSSTNADAEQWRNLNAILKSHRTLVDKELTQRVNGLIDSINSTLQNHELHNAPVSQVIELYNHRISSLNCAMSNMQQRLEQASAQITRTTQLNNMQNAELELFQSKNFELLISQERLQSQCKDLKQQTDKLKSNMSNLIKDFSESSEQLQVKERRLAVAASEILDYQKRCEELRSSLSAKTEEVAKLETHNKENLTRIEKLKKTVNAYEHDIKEKVRTIEERERDLAKTQKGLEEQREARKKSEDLVSVLEKQLQERKEQIENLEMEQKETEDLRKTIMSLMESKKPKRK
ncbi:uncharacterized protein LOC115629583 [Scaptodrosophila lebanonensis]|uniref:Uncharacterized protein LOC115629583 n=1 Tax=Drosophila lebanonensis TaxID=7225 RepID=A0A6J2TZM4_DROLE|nr:uncharacterized protein LOC115629583 [Scaptodrosophila lebanonensis]